MRITVHLAGAALASMVLVAPTIASAQTRIGSGRNVGLGLVLGYPHVGLALNVFLAGGRNSIQIDVAWGWNGDSRAFALRGDYLFWMPPLAQGGFGAVRWYVGPGLFAGWAPGRWCRSFGGDCYNGGGAILGVELPVGIGFQFRSIPIDLMIEVVPRVGLIHPSGFGPWFDPGGALHARYYF